MSKVTLVFEFEDGKEPALNVGTNFMGGMLVAAAWSDVINDQAIPVERLLPAPGDPVLLFTNGEGWVIGWRTASLAMGQKETGEWEWSFQLEALNNEDVRITHWASIPEEPAKGKPHD